MKKILCITFMVVLLSTVSAYAELNLLGDGSADSVTLGSSETMFKVSTNVRLRCGSTATQYTAASKHVAGGTTMFGTTESTDITSNSGLEADADVNTQTAGDEPDLDAA